MTAETISSNGFSVDLQLDDVVSWLEMNEPEVFGEFIFAFPEWDVVSWSGSWIDWKAMGVDADWAMWCIDWIEANTTVVWWEGEPWSEWPERSESEELAESFVNGNRSYVCDHLRADPNPALAVLRVVEALTVHDTADTAGYVADLIRALEAHRGNDG